MKLVYFEDEHGKTIALNPDQIIGIQQNRTPTNTPTTVLLVNGQFIRVRDSLDECERKLLSP